MRRLRSERGSVAITGLLFALALIVLIGTGVDFAHAFIVRRDLTAIADDAALAGSQQLDVQAWRQGQPRPQRPTGRTSRRERARRQPGHLRHRASCCPARSRCRCKRRLPTMMLRLVGIPDLTVSASATAEPKQP